MKKINGDKIKDMPKTPVIQLKSHQKLKELTQDDQLKVLFYHLKDNSQDNIYKLNSLRKLGEYFKADKNTIKKKLGILQDERYITKLEIPGDNKNIIYYKILRDEY